jgi:hypothetical protein
MYDVVGSIEIIETIYYETLTPGTRSELAICIHILFQTFLPSTLTFYPPSLIPTFGKPSTLPILTTIHLGSNPIFYLPFFPRFTYRYDFR